MLLLALLVPELCQYRDIGTTYTCAIIVLQMQVAEIIKLVHE